MNHLMKTMFVAAVKGPCFHSKPLRSRLMLDKVNRNYRNVLSRIRVRQKETATRTQKNHLSNSYAQ